MLCAAARPVYAAEESEPIDLSNVIRYQLSPEGNYVAEGGLNKYAGQRIKSVSDAQIVETRLRSELYIELSQLTAEQYAAFVEDEATYWWFERYIEDPEDPKYGYYGTNWVSIYIYEPSFMDWWENYQNRGTGKNTRIPDMEIELSTVVLNYRDWWSIDRVGTDCSNELNDGIPSWYDTGYVTIISPIDVEIRMIHTAENTYYTLYVSAGKPFRVKMKYGGYHIVSINETEISSTDSTLPYNNNLQVGWGENIYEVTPFKIDITKTVEKYDIKDKDISGMPDRSLDQNQEISEEKTVLEESEDEPTTEEKSHTGFFRILLLIIISASVVGTIIVLAVLNKRRG